MKNIGFYSFLVVFSVCYIIARSISLSKKSETKRKKQFLEQESKANAVRRADISSLDYIDIPLERLPLEENIDEEYSTLVKELKRLSEKRILNLSMYTNTELKLMYGPANLEDLSGYDNNFTELIRLLNKMADALLASDRINEARLILEYAVDIGSDISATYIHLGEIYAASDEKRLQELLQKAEALSSLSGQMIVTKLNSIKSGCN